MTILVTGATGFVGRAVVARLVQEGERPRCLVRDAERARGVLPAAGRIWLSGMSCILKRWIPLCRAWISSSTARS